MKRKVILLNCYKSNLKTGCAVCTRSDNHRVSAVLIKVAVGRVAARYEDNIESLAQLIIIFPESRAVPSLGVGV
jgi:hypothetical protein